MIQYEDIKKLQQYPVKSDSGVLSVYVNIDQSKASNLNHGFQTAVEDQFRQLIEGLADGNGDKLRSFKESKQQVIRFLKDYKPKGKSLVIFSDAKGGLWWQRDLQVELPCGARWSPRPWLRPLLDLIEDSERLVAVLIDKHTGRIFLLDPTGLQQEAEISSDVPNKHQTTGTDHIWSQSQMERDHEKHLKWHAKRLADDLNSVLERVRAGRVVICGPVEATSVFIDQLPKRVRQMIIDTIPVPMDISADKLAQKLRVSQKRAEEQEDLYLVESLITAALKRDHAVIGLSETVDAVHSGRVYRLVVSRNFRHSGSQCTRCAMLIVNQQNDCPMCPGEAEPAPDFVNRLSHKVLEQGGKVNIVSGHAEEKLNRDANVGAILRF